LTFAERETVDVARSGQRRFPAAAVVTLATVAVAGPAAEGRIS